MARVLESQPSAHRDMRTCSTTHPRARCLAMRQIDLDTIDVTNLNRQFLFQKQHVGQSKAVVAGAAVERMNPRICVTATHGNITEPERDVA